VAGVSDSGINDEVSVRVRPADEADAEFEAQYGHLMGDPIPPGEPVEPIGDRPGESAPKAKWIDYAARLGLDPIFAETRTKVEIMAWTDGTPFGTE
jgi:hypothetical protein